MQVPEIRDGELRVETLGDTLKKSRGRCREDDVIDVEQQVGDTRALFVDKERGVGCRGDEPKLSKVGGETLVPCSEGLLQTIQRSL